MPRLLLVCRRSRDNDNVISSAQSKSYRIPDVNLKEQILWGSTCEGPDGFWLAFGGEDQVSDIVPRTRIKVRRQMVFGPRTRVLDEHCRVESSGLR